MEVLTLTIFVSAMLVAGAVWLFVWSVRQRTHEHADRLALLPLEEEESEPSDKTPQQERPLTWK